MKKIGVRILATTVLILAVLVLVQHSQRKVTASTATIPAGTSLAYAPKASSDIKIDSMEGSPNVNETLILKSGYPLAALDKAAALRE